MGQERSSWRRAHGRAKREGDSSSEATVGGAKLYQESALMEGGRKEALEKEDVVDIVVHHRGGK